MGVKAMKNRGEHAGGEVVSDELEGGCVQGRASWQQTLPERWTAEGGSGPLLRHPRLRHWDGTSACADR